MPPPTGQWCDPPAHHPSSHSTSPSRPLRKMPKSSDLYIDPSQLPDGGLSSTRLHPSPTSPTIPSLSKVPPRKELPENANLPFLPSSPSSPQLQTSPKLQMSPGFSGSRSNHRPVPAPINEQNLRKVPHAATTGSLDAPSKSRHPYNRSPTSSAASLSHGNLLETSSVTSSSIPDSHAASEGHPSASGLKSNSIPRVNAETISHKKVPKRVFHNILARSQSIRQTEDPQDLQPNMKPKPRGRHLEPEPFQPPGQGPKTAPLDHERSFREMFSSSNRNKSADRAVESEDEEGPPKSSASREGALWTNIKQSSTKAADGIGRAGKGLFGKITRSGSDSLNTPVVDDNYVCHVINLPLVEQTRKTRIRNRMEDAKDKTEFWMPSLPYRCIDFLNLKGIEEEGLYRVPGSGREIRHWQSRFDKELDVNLLDEPELYDINIIGSMLKSWLRELPDEIFPKATQTKIATQCAGAKTTPQLMKDELSKLPPFHYYILFAITCHISLLHANCDKNKMSYQNLCICFQPCMKIDGFCFQFLIMDWKNCWQGCWTEKEYLAQEYRIREDPAPPPPPSRSGRDSRASPVGMSGSSVSSSAQSHHSQQTATASTTTTFPTLGGSETRSRNINTPSASSSRSASRAPATERLPTTGFSVDAKTKPKLPPARPTTAEASSSVVNRETTGNKLTATRNSRDDSTVSPDPEKVDDGMTTPTKRQSKRNSAPMIGPVGTVSPMRM